MSGPFSCLLYKLVTIYGILPHTYTDFLLHYQYNEPKKYRCYIQWHQKYYCANQKKEESSNNSTNTSSKNKDVCSSDEKWEIRKNEPLSSRTLVE